MHSFPFEHARNGQRRIIEVKERLGIPSEHQKLLYNVMKECQTGERLIVTLFFMADLPVDEHTLNNIERNYRLIFPPIGKQNLKPEDFRNFRATCITNHLHGDSEYFVNPKRGRWMNSETGNQLAIDILHRLNIRMNIAGKPGMG